MRATRALRLLDAFPELGRDGPESELRVLSTYAELLAGATSLSGAGR